MKKFFDEVIRINTLDAKLYEKVQQTMIDALDQGKKSVMIGRREPDGYGQIRLWSLKKRCSERDDFENCVQM